MQPNLLCTGISSLYFRAECWTSLSDIAPPSTTGVFQKGRTNTLFHSSPHLPKKSEMKHCSPTTPFFSDPHCLLVWIQGHHVFPEGLPRTHGLPFPPQTGKESTVPAENYEITHKSDELHGPDTLSGNYWPQSQ